MNPASKEAINMVTTENLCKGLDFVTSSHPQTLHSQIFCWDLGCSI